MEHLPCGSHSLNLRIPYICTQQYDQIEGWLEYPSRQDISLEHLRRCAFRKYEPQELERFLQNWLFFGLLDAILPCKVLLGEFIYSDHGYQFVTTVHWKRYLRTWEELHGSLPLTERAELFQRNQQILNEARGIIYLLVDYPTSLQQNPFPPLRRTIALSCAALGESLNIANTAILNPNQDLESSLGSKLPWGGNAFFLEIMESKGWCPFLTAELQQQAPLLSTYYLSSIGPPRIKRNHRNCSDFNCAALRIESRHAIEGCSCASIRPNIQDIVTEIQKNNTPVLRFHYDADWRAPSGRVEVDMDHVATQYVAISHVWSDGLGNPGSNSMPRCQLVRVQQAVNELYKYEDAVDSPAWFWIDTICVPTDKEYGREKRMALDKMKSIYVEADKVLIIDSEVAACPDNSEPLEILARVRLSNWNRRLWTLQEGYFARAAYFLVGASTISLMELFKASNRNSPDMYAIKIWDGLVESFNHTLARSIIEHENSDESSQPHFGKPNEASVVQMIRALSFRSSTFLKDEPLCLAYLFNVSPAAIEDTPNNERMKKLFELLDEETRTTIPRGCIPPGVILVAGKRLSAKGFRWAPESFLIGPHGHQSLKSYPFDIGPGLTRPSGILDPHGLLVKFPGLLLKSKESRMNKFYDGHMAKQFIIENHASHKIAEIEAGSRLPSAWRATYSRHDNVGLWETVAPRRAELETFALIICSYGPTWQQTSEAVLAKIVHKQDDQPIQVSRVCKLLISAAPEFDRISTKEPLERACGDWLPITQTWVVD